MEKQQEVWNCILDSCAPHPAQSSTPPGPRPFGSGNLLLETYRWLSRTYPWFNRSKGQDHIWVMPHDEGACSAPKEIWPGKWGDRGRDHAKDTGDMISLLLRQESFLVCGGTILVHIPTSSGIILSHWGRMDFPHTSNSQYHADNYAAVVHHEWFPGGYAAHTSQTHPCFDPNKDLVIPCFKVCAVWILSTRLQPT